jgi:hypothetical protein
MGDATHAATEAATIQPLALVGGYPGGVWTCAWCAAELGDGAKIRHRDDCRWIADIAAQAAAAERERLWTLMIAGDPGTLERAFREHLDDDDAADCAGIVADLLRQDGAG